MQESKGRRAALNLIEDGYLTEEDAKAYSQELLRYSTPTGFNIWESWRGVCPDMKCGNRDGLTGRCRLTACNKMQQGYCELRTPKKNKLEIKFPQKIGKVTFHSYAELVKWVEDQQKMNEDPDYGRGTYA